MQIIQNFFFLFSVSYAWFPPFRCRSAVSVRAVAVKKLRKNSVSAVKNYVAYVKKFRCAVAVTAAVSP